jgi:DNA polymerase-1
MGALALSERMNIPIPDARKLRWDFFDAYPYIRRFTQEAPQIARERGYIRTILGRRAYFDDNFHMAVSRVIQGSAADQMKTALLQGLQYCESTPDIEILLTIHDSILFQCRAGTDLTEFRRVIEDMTNLYQIVEGKKVPMRVPFPVEIGLGKDWSEASYGKKT